LSKKYDSEERIIKTKTNKIVMLKFVQHLQKSCAIKTADPEKISG